MAAGDVRMVLDGANVSVDQTITIQPAAGETWLITGLFARVAATGGGNIHTLTIYVTNGGVDLPTAWNVTGDNLTLDLRGGIYAHQFGVAGIDSGSNERTEVMENGIIINNSNYLKLFLDHGGGGSTRFDYVFSAIILAP